jgi:hypothetical protein
MSYSIVHYQFIIIHCYQLSYVWFSIDNMAKQNIRNLGQVLHKRSASLELIPLPNNPNSFPRSELP